MTTALYSIFNAGDLIYSSLSSVAQCVDEIRIYDGRFAEYKCVCGKDHEESCDNTLKEIERWEKDSGSIPRLRVFQWHPMGELEKRTKMLQDVPNGTVTLTIDDDELIVGDPASIRDFDKQCGYIDLLMSEAGPGTGVMMPLARLIKTSPGIHYETVFRIVDEKGLIVDMRQDNKYVPYHRRAPNRNYLPGTTFMVELAGFRSRKRSKAAMDYNAQALKSIWKRPEDK